MKYYRSHVLVCVDPECAGKRRQAHVIDPDICIRCGICMQGATSMQSMLSELHFVDTPGGL